MLANFNLNFIDVIVILGGLLWLGIYLFRLTHPRDSSVVNAVVSVQPSTTEEDDEETGDQILGLSWLSKTDVIESRITLKISDVSDDVEWDDGILTAVDPEDKRIVLTCPPRSALVYCAEQTPTDYDDVEYLLTLKDGDTTLGEWKVYSDSGGPNLEGNYWWVTDDDEQTRFMIFAGRELTLIAREM